jgi:hypothetical protein
MRSLKGKAARLSYAQVLVVAPAFALMVIASYFFTSDIERKHLQKNVKDTILYTEANIKSDLLESEAMVGSVSETIRDIIMRGNAIGRVREYILYINNYMASDEKKRALGVIRFYGIFDVYGGQFLFGSDDWMPPEDYDPASRPWYTAAVDAAGDVVTTQPYMDIYSGEVSVTFSRRIFDNDGAPLGIVCLDMLLNRIKQLSIDTQLAENGFGFLLSSTLEVIAHPDPSMQGEPLHSVKGGIADFEDEVREKGRISERIMTDYRGIKSIVFFFFLQNGWYMGIVTPKNKYYQSTGDLAITLTVLGMAMAVLVSAILLRMIAKKQKADKLTKTMFDTSLKKLREAIDSQKMVNILKNILNGLDAMIYVTVPNTGEILFVNDRMKEHYNIEGDCVGQLCYKVFQIGMNERCEFCPCHVLDKEPGKPVVWVEYSSLTKSVYRNTDCYIE